MFKLSAVLVVLGAAASPALAAEQTVTLAVENMHCVTCPYIVQQSLAAVDGVIAIAVHVTNETAVVAFDDARTDVAALVKATTDAGYPSELAQ